MAKDCAYFRQLELDPLPLLLDLTGGTFLRLEGGRSVLKELLLPAIKDSRLQPSSSHKSETLTLYKRWRRRMATFSSV